MLSLWLFSNLVLWSQYVYVGVGDLKLWMNVVVLLLVGPVWLLKKNGPMAKISKKVFWFLLLFLVFSFFVAIAGPCVDSFQKFFITAPVFLFIIVLGVEIGWNASDNDWLKLQKVAIWCLLVCFAGLALQMLFPGWFSEHQLEYAESRKAYSGIFSEPSHVGFSLFPSVAILLLAEEKKFQLTGLLALLGLIILSPSSTLIALTLGWFIYRIMVTGKFIKGLVVAFAVASAVVLMAAIVDYDKYVTPILERIAGVAGNEDSQNFSSLVYVQGWQDALYNFQRTHWLGLGFNMMGCKPLPDSPIRPIVEYNYAGDDSNTVDGSFVFSKLMSETGIIGIALPVILIWWIVRLEKDVRATSACARNAKADMQMTLIVYFLIAYVVRGSGYFNTELLILVVALSGSFKWYRENHFNLHKNAGVS